MQKKQVTVHVPTAITLMLEDENLTKEKIESMVNNTISEMSYDFSIDTNSCSYDDGRIGSIVETEIIGHEISCVVDIEDTNDPTHPMFFGSINCVPFGRYDYRGVREGMEYKIVHITCAPAYEYFKDSVKAMAEEYFAFGVDDRDLKRFNELLDDPDKSHRIDIVLCKQLKGE
jgi:hypothetical protein